MKKNRMRIAGITHVEENIKKVHFYGSIASYTKLIGRRIGALKKMDRTLFYNVCLLESSNFYESSFIYMHK